MAGDGHGSKAVVAALLANAGIAVAKFVAFAITGATSMLAEGVHSVADSGNQALLLLGAREAKRSESDDHPFGYGRARYFWSFVVSVVLFALGSLFALIEGVEKLRHPHELSSPLVAVVVLMTGIVLEGLSFRTAVKEAGPLRNGRSWWQFVRRSKSPELPVVLLEDFGALTGLGIALAGVGLAQATGDPVFDAIGTIAIGALLGVISIVLAVEMKSLLIGEAASREDRNAIVSALLADAAVHSLIYMQTQHLGPAELLVAAKIELDPALDFGGVVAAINAAEARIREAVPIARVLYIEPDRAAR